MSRAAAVGLVVLLALAGCSSTDSVSKGATAAATSAAPAPAYTTATATPLPTSSPLSPEAQASLNAKVAAAEEARAVRRAAQANLTARRSASDFSFDCSLSGAEPGSKNNYVLLDDVFAAGASGCLVDVQADHALTATEQKAVALYKKSAGGDTSPDETPAEALGTMLGDCTEEGSTYKSRQRMQGALLLCPAGPYAPSLGGRAAGTTIPEGSRTVGSEVVPGTYRTEPDISDCYWERTRTGGDILANDFVTHAASGVTVTIGASDGSFTSRHCGDWTRVR